MRKGYTVRTAWNCSFGDKFLVVTNYQFSNSVVNYPMIKYSKIMKTNSDVGMWKIKQLKN